MILDRISQDYFFVLFFFGRIGLKDKYYPIIGFPFLQIYPDVRDRNRKYIGPNFFVETSLKSFESPSGSRCGCRALASTTA